MERIIASAYKVKPEFSYKRDHWVYKTKTKEMDDIYNCRIGRHHAEILHMWRDQIDQDTDGFYTSYGRWVDRKEAARIALAAGQIKKCHYFGGESLDSSDIFDLDYESNLII
jgi:hypothetical protein